jgi:hypothetical protein
MAKAARGVYMKLCPVKFYRNEYGNNSQFYQ